MPTSATPARSGSSLGGVLLSTCILASSAIVDAQGTRTADLSLRGVFTSDLPEIGRKYSLRLLLHPHFGDLIKYDYLRTDIGLKYSVSNHLEFSGAVASYVGHGLGDAKLFGEFGFGELKFAAKYRLGNKLLPGWDTAVGAGYSVPINHPPVDVTDGLDHRTFFATFARPWASHPDIRVFWGAGFEFVDPTSTPGRHDDNELRDDNSYLSAGLILDRGRTHYTFETKWTTSRLLGDTAQDVFELRPGVIWELGRPLIEGRRSRWLLGLGLSTSFGPDGTEIGLGARLRMDLDFKRLWRRERQPAIRP